MSSHIFSSLVLRELIKEIERIGNGTYSSEEEWAEAIVTKYSHELDNQPVLYLTEEENLQARQFLAESRNSGVDLADRATRYVRGSHMAEIKDFLKDKQDGWRVLLHPGSVEEIECPLPSDEKILTSFVQWAAMTNVWRLTLAMTEIDFHDAASGTSESLINQLPEAWEEKLDECMKITEDFAALPAPKGWGLPIRRRDLKSILPEPGLEIDASGLLSDVIINSWFRILLAQREQEMPGSMVNVLPDSLDLHAATPREIAENIMLVDSKVDTILFPTVIKEQDHCILVVAHPRKHELSVYDSLGYKSTKALQKDRPWLKEHYRPTEEDPWEVKWVECPQQGEEAACGVFMLINALFATLSEDPTHGYTPQDTMFLRRFIAAVICTGKLPENL